MKVLSRALAIAALAFVSSSHAFFIPTPKYVYEYVNDYTGHYVLLDVSEGAVVESGAAGPGWERTGYSFEVPDPTAPLLPAPEWRSVCRFYSAVNNSHFFTANSDECESLKAPGTGWAYEKIAFYTVATGSPACPSNYAPIYRVYNGRAAQHDVNHRFTPDIAVRDRMIAQGWIDEGIAFCTTGSQFLPLKTFAASATTIRPAAECESRVGACVALKQLAPMPNLIRRFLPPSFVTRNPDYPLSTDPITGVATDLFTAQPTGDAAAIAAHSFVNMYDVGGPPFGVHVTARDRLAGSSAAISPMYEFPGAAPAPGGVDERVFPWNGPKHHSLVAVAQVNIPTIKGANAANPAHGELLVQFGDASTGHSFSLSVQAYGTTAPVDFTAPDPDTGAAIVSTVFRADPAFGTRIEGDFATCNPDAPCTSGYRALRFGLDDVEFGKALERARTIDPTLSPDVSNYFVGQLRMQNEASGDAELGAAVSALFLQLWY